MRSGVLLAIIGEKISRVPCSERRTSMSKQLETSKLNSKQQCARTEIEIDEPNEYIKVNVDKCY